MAYLNISAQWEQFFIQEAVELEEKMKSLDIDSLNKSKIRICLENNILNWPQFEKWMMSELGCCSLKSTIAEEEIQKFLGAAKQAQELYSSHDFWNEDLIPFIIWNDQLIVLGLQYNENLVAIDNHIFILAPPQILSDIVSRLADPEIKAESYALSEEASSGNLDGFDMNIAAPDISFKTSEILSMFPDPKAEVAAEKEFVFSSATATPTAKQSVKSVSKDDSIWNMISDRHDEYTSEVKKQFDGFIVLQISQNKTEVFKMDTDLSKKALNPIIFQYGLDQDSPFKKVFESGVSAVFPVSQLNIKIGGFEHACITPLRRGPSIIGFFVGFKISAPSEAGRDLLEELAEETAS